MVWNIKRKICGLLAANVIETVHKDVSFHYAFFYRRLDDGTMAGHGDGRKFLVIRGFVQLKSGRNSRWNTTLMVLDFYDF